MMTCLGATTSPGPLDDGGRERDRAPCSIVLEPVALFGGTFVASVVG